LSLLGRGEYSVDVPIAPLRLSTAISLVFLAVPLRADALHANLTEYKTAAGLAASIAGDALVVTWQGDGLDGRLTLAIHDRAPVIRELAARRKGGEWIPLAGNVAPEFRVVSGLRRMTNQQLDPLAGIGIKITPEILERDKWEAFWDAPLHIPGDEPAHGDCTPPQRGVLQQPGLARSPEELKRAAAFYRVQSCAVKTNGARIEISFPGVQLGVFSGRLQYTVYQGANLIRQEVIVSTREPSVAYKYDAGVQGVAIQTATRAVWRDIANHPRETRLGDGAAAGAVTVVSGNRILGVEAGGER
jgi:hypothetical protein